MPEAEAARPPSISFTGLICGKWRSRRAAGVPAHRASVEGAKLLPIQKPRRPPKQTQTRSDAQNLGFRDLIFACLVVVYVACGLFDVSEARPGNE